MQPDQDVLFITSTKQKNYLTRYVGFKFLQFDNELLARIYSGSEFQMAGAMKEKGDLWSQQPT